MFHKRGLRKEGGWVGVSYRKESEKNQSWLGGDRERESKTNDLIFSLTFVCAVYWQCLLQSRG